jgi:hypothetical protein
MQVKNERHAGRPAQRRQAPARDIQAEGFDRAALAGLEGNDEYERFPRVRNCGGREDRSQERKEASPKMKLHGSIPKAGGVGGPHCSGGGGTARASFCAASPSSS